MKRVLEGTYEVKCEFPVQLVGGGRRGVLNQALSMGRVGIFSEATVIIVNCRAAIL